MNSTYFTVEEFVCRSGVAYPAIWVESRLSVLCHVLDTLRAAWQSPLFVVCGYRDQQYNQVLVEASKKRNGGISGVAADSQHIHGRAADIRPVRPTKERVSLLHDLAQQLYADGKLPDLGGLGWYPKSLWVHLDVRPRTNGHLAQWVGDGEGSER